MPDFIDEGFRDGFGSIVKQAYSSQSCGLELVVFIHQPLQYARRVYFMGWSMRLVLFVENDPVVNYRHVDFHLPLVDSFNGELLFLREAYLKDVFPHL